MKTHAYFLIIVLLFIFSSCSSSSGGGDSSTPTTTTTTVSSSGATATSGNSSLSLTFPANAVSSDTEVTITDFSEGDFSGFTLDPSGTNFAQAVAISFLLGFTDLTNLVDEDGNSIDLSIGALSLELFLVNDDGTVEILDNLSTTTNVDSETVTATTELTHFTRIVHIVNTDTYTMLVDYDNEQLEGANFSAQISFRLHDKAFEFSDSVTLKPISAELTLLQLSSSGEVSTVSAASQTRSDMIASDNKITLLRNANFRCGEGTGDFTVKLTGTFAYEKFVGGVSQGTIEIERTITFKGPVRCEGLPGQFVSGVLLDYAHGTLPKGSRVALNCITGGRTADPEELDPLTGSGCDCEHLHDSISISGQSISSFDDEEPSNCGHGCTGSFLREDLDQNCE